MQNRELDTASDPFWFADVVLAVPGLVGPAIIYISFSKKDEFSSVFNVQISRL